MELMFIYHPQYKAIAEHYEDPFHIPGEERYQQNCRILTSIIREFQTIENDTLKHCYEIEIPCPYCQTFHKHGTSPEELNGVLGARNSHCTNPKSPHFKKTIFPEPRFALIESGGFQKRLEAFMNTKVSSA